MNDIDEHWTWPVNGGRVPPSIKSEQDVSRIWRLASENCGHGHHEIGLGVMEGNTERIYACLTERRLRDLNLETAATIDDIFKTATEELLASEEKPVTEFSLEENRLSPLVAPTHQKLTIKTRV